MLKACLSVLNASVALGVQAKALVFPFKRSVRGLVIVL